MWRGIWDSQGRERFREKLGEVEMEERGLEAEMKEMEGRIREALEEVKRERDGEGRRRRGWWDGECKEQKKEMRRKLREWRRGRCEREEYRKGRKEYKEMCEKKKKEENERWERKVAEAKRESDVWEVVNRERKKRKKVSREIEMREWKKYFMELLGGIEERVVRGGEGKKRAGGEKDISREEIKGVLRKIKERKATGMDKIPGEI